MVGDLGITGATLVRLYSPKNPVTRFRPPPASFAKKMSNSEKLFERLDLFSLCYFVFVFFSNHSTKIQEEKTKQKVLM